MVGNSNSSIEGRAFS